MKKKTKLKEFIKKFKELWAIPRYHAIIKLSLYGVMFLMIMIMANLYSSINNNQTEQIKSYTEIINSIDINNCEIMYDLKINDSNFKLEGKIADNILTGYLDDNNKINKITIKDNKAYQIINEEQILSEELTTKINSSLLIPKNIINLVEKEQAIIEKNAGNTTYTFDIYYYETNYEIKIVMNQETLTNIIISNLNIEYNMKMNFDK